MDEAAGAARISPLAPAFWPTKRCFAMHAATSDLVPQVHVYKEHMHLRRRTRCMLQRVQCSLQNVHMEMAGGLERHKILTILH